MSELQRTRPREPMPRPWRPGPWTAHACALLWTLVLLLAAPAPADAAHHPYHERDHDRIAASSATGPHAAIRSTGALQGSWLREQERTGRNPDVQRPGPGTPASVHPSIVATGGTPSLRLRRVGIFVPLCERLPYDATAPPFPG